VDDQSQLSVEHQIRAELTSRLRYPPAWLDERMVTERRGEAVIAELRTADGDPFFWAIAVPKHEGIDTAEELARRVLVGQRLGGLAWITDGSTHRHLRRRFDNDTCEYVPDVEAYGGARAGRQEQLFSESERVRYAGRGALVPLTTRLENVLFEAHSHIRDVDGLHADEALDELCKLLFAKLFDEEQTEPQAAYVMQRWRYGTTEECAAAVRRLYVRASLADRERIEACGGSSQGVFSAPLRLSSPALVRVVETLEHYSLLESSADIKGRAFQRVLGPAMRSGMGQYFTPEPVVTFIVNLVRPTLHEKVLDPFCGSAHFLTSTLAHIRQDVAGAGGDEAADQMLAEYAQAKLFGVEKSDRMVRIARTDMRLHGDGNTNLQCADSLLAFHNYANLAPESFRIVLTNPPFGSLLNAEAIAQLGEFRLAAGRRTVPLEVLGLERSVQFLRPGGRLGIVLPESLLSNTGAAPVREWLASVAKVRAIVSLPIETFTPFGANIKTSIVVARRWMPGERVDDYPVFLGQVTSIGYDAAGRPKCPADLGGIASEFQRFIDAHGW
jgi:type I restriction enzyme M protein